MDNLIICEFCGTAYDPQQGFCPICQGRPTNADSYMGDHYDFDERPLEDDEPQRRPIGGKIALLAALFILFAGFTGYILYSFELLPFLKPVEIAAEPEFAPCTSLVVDATELSLTEAGQSVQLHTSVQPANTTDRVIFSSDNTACVSVTQDGTVTAKAEGTANVTILCGEYMAFCPVTCNFAAPTPDPEPEPTPEPESTPEPEPVIGDPLGISAVDISFFAATENTDLILTGGDGSLPKWESEDPAIASVDETGHVVALSKGTTTVTATVGSQKASCIVRCQFE